MGVMSAADGRSGRGAGWFLVGGIAGATAWTGASCWASVRVHT